MSTTADSVSEARQPEEAIKAQFTAKRGYRNDVWDAFYALTLQFFAT